MDLRESLSKISFFEVAQDLSGLSEDEREALRHCVRAAEVTTDIYLSQTDPRLPSMRAALAARTDDEGRDLSRYFEVNGGPWDGFNGDNPFVPGVEAKPKAGAFYPADMTKQEWEKRLAGASIEDRAALESHYSIIKRVAGKLGAVSYSEEYKDRLDEAARELEAAAKLLPEGPLKNFLVLRAAAFRSNDYWESDIAWIDTDGSPFEVTIGPYEVYADGLFGLKATFEGFIALPDREATADVQKFGAVMPEFDAALAARLGYNAKGGATPLEIVRDVYRGGEAAFGRQFVAYNLPNNRKIHELKGSKKVFSRTMMEAKFSILGQPVAERVLRPDMLRHYRFRNRLLFVIGHELAHGIGPGTRMVDGREVSFEILLKDLHSMLEEAKADMLGIALLAECRKQKLITDDELYGAVVSEIVTFAPAWRASLSEAHAAGSLIEYNWLVDRGAVRYEMATGKFDIDPEKALAAIIALSEEFLRLQMEADYEKTAAFAKRWGFVAPEIPGMVARFADLPIEVHPIYKA